MTKTYTTAAIILRGASYGEGNRIYTFYSRDRGKFSAVARGVRKQKSKLKGHLQLGNCCDLELIKGKGLDIVSSAAARETFPANREKAEGYFYMSYFLELCNDFTPEEQADAAIYDLLRGVLGALATTEPKLLARYYELQLLQHGGFLPDLSRCSLCGTALNGGCWNPRYDGLICSHCGSGTAVTPKAHFALKYLLNVEVTLVPRLKVDADTMALLSGLTRRMIEHSLEKKVRSLTILDQLTLDNKPKI